MAIIASGTLTPAGASEEQFSGADITTVGVLILHVDRSAMALGDIIILRTKRNILSGGTIQTFFTGVYFDVGGDAGVVSIPLKNEFLSSYTVEYETGTPVALPFSIETP